MKQGRVLTENHDIRALLEGAKTIAVLGLSAKPEKDSHQIGKYLKEQGYRVIPVSPG